MTIRYTSTTRRFRLGWWARIPGSSVPMAIGYRVAGRPRWGFSNPYYKIISAYFLSIKEILSINMYKRTGISHVVPTKS